MRDIRLKKKVSLPRSFLWLSQSAHINFHPMAVNDTSRGFFPIDPLLWQAVMKDFGSDRNKVKLIRSEAEILLLHRRFVKQRSYC